MRHSFFSLFARQQVAVQRFVNVSVILFMLGSNFSALVTPALAAPQLAGHAPDAIQQAPHVAAQPRAAQDDAPISIAAGTIHTCALTNSGGVKCWGSNTYGGLGDGTTTDHSTPMDVNGLSSSVMAITAGLYHTCALTTSGGVKCWGWNSNGQLGDGTTIQRLTPVDVSGLTSGVSAIVAGQTHTCALTNSGGVKCWGRNDLGMLGNGTTTDSSTPVDVSGLNSGVTAINLGGFHTCALTASGGIKCWGFNTYGQLGDGTTTAHSIPVDVSGLSNGVTAIAGGQYHTCALTASGGVKCWGYNLFGQLGDGTTTDSSIPTDVSGLSSGVTVIAVGAYHNCALTSGSAVKCWGRNDLGMLGNGTTIQSNIPVDVNSLSSGVTAIAAGGLHNCVLITSGVMCWGYNSNGQLGDGTTTQRTTPVDVIWPIIPTPTVTLTNTDTPSLTETSTETMTLVDTETPTVTLTPTTTLSPTVSVTETETPTVTLTPTITETYTETATLTLTPTLSPTVTVTETDTPTVTLTPTPTLTGSATHTATLTPKPTLSATVSPTHTLTADPSQTSLVPEPIPGPGQWVDILPNGVENFDEGKTSWPPSGSLWRVNYSNCNGFSCYWDNASYKIYYFFPTGFYHRAYSGQWAAWPKAGGSAGDQEPAPNNAYYVNNMDTRMIYGPFNMTNGEQIHVNFFLWLDTEPGYDYLTLETSINGQDFYEVSRWNGSAASWQTKDVYLGLAGQSQVWLAWRFHSDITNPRNYEGPWVDDIRIQKWVNSTPTPTRTRTPTITLTPTKTLTRTKTLTPTKTYTPTITRTPTKTYTPSKTSTRTATFTPTRTRTSTPTPTWTRSRTPTATYTYTPTRTSTPTLVPPGLDLARGKPATASGSCSFLETADKAVNYAWAISWDKWCDNTSTSKWWQVDLGLSYALQRIVIYHAGAGGEDTSWNTRDFAILTSNDNSHWSTVAYVTGNTASITYHDISPTNARYIKINIINPGADGIARLYEVFAFGTNPLTPTVTPTKTSTKSPTPTRTRTATPRQTRTPCLACTSTRTRTATRTFTRTPTRTRTPTKTPTSTPSRTLTPCQGCVPTPTLTATRTYTLAPTATPTVTKTPTQTPSSTLGAATKQMKAYVLVYANQAPAGASALQLATNLSNQMMQSLTRGTIYHGYNNPNAAPYLGWKMYGGAVHAIPGQEPLYCLPANISTATPTSPAITPTIVAPQCLTDNDKTADFSAVFDDITRYFGPAEGFGNFCQFIRDQDIQEVWVWTDGNVKNGPERVAIGPNYRAGKAADYRVPDCGVQYAVMGLNYTRDLDDGLESYAHRVEDAFNQLFPCEFDVPVFAANGIDPYWPVDSKALFQNDCGSSHGYIARANLETDVAQCGWAHFPPNVSYADEQNEKDLEYRSSHRNDLKFFSTCVNWNPNPATAPTVTPVPIDCTNSQAWHCMGLDSSNKPKDKDGDKTRFHVWWMQNLPGAGHTVVRCNGSSMGNWWNYLRGDTPKLSEVNCNPNPTTTNSLSGQVVAGQLAGATIHLFILESNATLTNVPLDDPIITAADGSYTIPDLPDTVNGKTLVIAADGGSFTDEATGQVVSFAGHTLFAGIPDVDLNRPIGGVITPVTDIAFRLAISNLSKDPSLSPGEQVDYYNFWMSILFHLGIQEGIPNSPEMVVPADLFDGELHDPDTPESLYALALAGISQQAADAGISPVDWIAQLSEDAADGQLDGAAQQSVLTIAEAVDAFIAGPRSPFPATPTPTATATPTSTPAPITLTFTSIAAQDGWVLESSETSARGGTLSSTARVLLLGDDASNRQYRAILSFNTSSLPDNAIITSAVLKLKQNGTPVGANPFNVLGNLWVDLRKGKFGSAARLQLADFRASATVAKVGVFKPTPSDGWYTLNLNATGRKRINTTAFNGGLTQFRLRFAKDDNNNHIADFIKFLSGNAPSGKPVLVITYILP